MPPYRIYISSTEMDLKEERQNLKRSLEQANYEPLCMEKYPAFHNRPKDKCEQDVRKANFYVVMVGDRYGSRPVKQDGSLFEKSFTEYEYEAAVEANIPVLAFVKKINKIKTDVLLEKFLQRLYDNHGVKEFSDADDLSKQVLIAITNLTGRTASKGINPNLKFYCDRNEQSIRFDNLYYGIKNNEHIHFYLLIGHELNYHQSFVNRYKCEFKVRNYDEEPVDISFNVRINPAENESKVAQTIKELMNSGIKKQFGVEPLPQINAHNLFQLLGRLKKRFLFINLNIQNSYIKPSFADIYKRGIEKFYNDFTSPQEDTYLDKKIIIFLNLRLADDIQNKDILKKIFDENPFYEDKILPLLNKVNCDDIQEWLESNNIERNPKRIQAIVRKYFQALAEEDSEESFYMADAEIEMEKIIEEYNLRDCFEII